MSRSLFATVTFTVTAALAISPANAAQKIDGKDKTFIQKAAQEQLAEIALGQLAMKKGSDKKVKEFAAELVEDHRYASQEAKDLSAKEGIYLPVEMDARQKKEQQRLSRLSGSDFDKAFIAHLLKTHRKDVHELQKTTATLKNENVKQWAEVTEPILAVHLKKAESVAEALGVPESK
jgi:putative membrane protein